jgi:hypothetical protein
MTALQVLVIGSIQPDDPLAPANCQRCDLPIANHELFSLPGDNCLRR